jgi:hypothetical protein
VKGAKQMSFLQAGSKMKRQLIIIGKICYSFATLVATLMTKVT